MTLTNSDWNPAVEAESLRAFIARPVDGVIFVDTWLHSANEAPIPSEKPYVFVNRLFSAADCHLVRPALTTVTLPCCEMGQAAARLLLSRREDQDKPATADRVRGRLVVRESCGAKGIKEGEKEFWIHTMPRRLLYEMTGQSPGATRRAAEASATETPWRERGRAQRPDQPMGAL